MASLIVPRLSLVRVCFMMLVLIVTAIAAQDRSPDPVPVWPEDGRIPPQYPDRYVFLSSDKHSVIVLAPEEPGTDITGPKRVVKVPLWNNFVPSASISRLTIQKRHRTQSASSHS